MRHLERFRGRGHGNAVGWFGVGCCADGQSVGVFLSTYVGPFGFGVTLRFDSGASKPLCIVCFVFLVFSRLLPSEAFDRSSSSVVWCVSAAYSLPISVPG